jgi:hypothetical protein
MKPAWFIFLFLIISLCVEEEQYAQDNWWKEKKYKSEEKQKKFNNCKLVFLNISDGLVYSNVNYISPYFQNEVYLSIQNTEKRYYNREQCSYIVESFINNNPVSSFKWRNSSRSENYAFAVGKYKYQKNGFINNYSISVSLKYINDLWLVDQIIVN